MPHEIEYSLMKLLGHGGTALRRERKRREFDWPEEDELNKCLTFFFLYFPKTPEALAPIIPFFLLFFVKTDINGTGSWLIPDPASSIF